MPDFKTLADFRKDNGLAIQAVCAQFVVLCRRLNMVSKAVVAIDGSKFKAVDNRDRNVTLAKVGARLEQVEGSIARYLAALDRADREKSDVAEVRTTRLSEKIAGLREQMQILKAMRVRVEAAPDRQMSPTDPDARSMATHERFQQEGRESRPRRRAVHDLLQFCPHPQNAARDARYGRRRVGSPVGCIRHRGLCGGPRGASCEARPYKKRGATVAE